MAYENRWNERDQHERSDRFRGDDDRWRADCGDGQSGDQQRARQPSGERSGGPSGPTYRDEAYGRPAERSAWTADSDYGRGRDRDVGRGLQADRDGGFGETGGRYSDSFRRDDDSGSADAGAGSQGRSFWNKASDKVQSWLGEDRGGGGRDQARAGEHRGRGPKGYRRSDDRIREDVSDRLSEDSWLDASDIEVRVEGGEVTLDGTVAARDDKRRAEDICDHVSGVGHVQNNLRVKRPGDVAPSDGPSGGGAIGG